MTMNKRIFLSFLAVALMVTLSACSSTEDDAFLGSRDDIIVKNRNMPTPMKAPVIEEEDTAEIAVTDNVETEAETEADKIVQQAAAQDPITVMDDVKADQDTEAMMDEAVEVAAVEAKPVQEQSVASTAKPMENVAMRLSPQQQAQKRAQQAAMEAEKKAKANMSGDLPPNAKPGECYAKVLIPAVVENKDERVQISQEREVLARIIPAKYEIVQEKVLVKEARQYWKKGEGAIQKVDEATGQIMCLVEEPAVYKTVEKRTLIEPERPEYKTEPAQFETITKSHVVTPERMEWRRILCETNVTPAIIMATQRALQTNGYDAGVIDGRYGAKTAAALRKFQADNNLAQHGMTYETLDRLGVSLAGSGDRKVTAAAGA